MPTSPYLPIYTLTRGEALTRGETHTYRESLSHNNLAARGEIVESIHFGAAAVVNARGQLIAWFGDPQVVTYLRSTAKPLQALSFLEHGGAAAYGLTPREIAVICASHSGTDEHVRVLRSIQAKAGIAEAALLCGIHPTPDEATAEAMRQRGEEPTPIRHNCSGKHTGMLAYARMENLPTDDYINPEHPIQQRIRQTFAEMCSLDLSQIKLGTDGCSAPNFAVPLYNAAWAFARLCDPEEGRVTPPARARACRAITAAMAANPDMVGGPGRFDTRLMQAVPGRIIAKGGAEGYQGIGLLPGAAKPGSPGLGIAFKISDGDPKGRARPAVALEILRQMGILSPQELSSLADFGPVSPVYNWRKLLVGQARPCFELQFEA